MLFHKFLRELLEAWGKKPKGTTVWELLKEVLQNLPFGVKKQLVEIVPEQSLTAQRVSTSCQAALPFFAEIGKQYIVKINGTTYKCEAKSSNGVPVMGDQTTSNFVNYPFNLCCNGTGYHHWDPELGKTITLAIYEEKEIVKPLDPKFVGASGGGVVFYVSRGTGNDYIYKDADCTEKVTAEEIKALIGQSIVLSAFGESFMYVCSMMLWDNTWFELHCFNYDMSNKISYYTAEKTNNTPV